ncbi:MAG: pyrroline-5-carboxylate reductase, partial [Paracoccaceae bacterium]|nr:pyrroline-5-carboxylate reductase [Paracoccaceae bacterium]
AVVGEVVEVDTEDQIDIVTGVSGSGPAYVFHMIEALAAAARAQGLSEALAMRLARHTVTGAGELAHRSSETAQNLRVNVTSPGGTTAAALSVLMAEGLGLTELMTRTVDAAVNRGRELGK